MTASKMQTEPTSDVYDVVIVGGASMGSSVAWYLSNNLDFDGRVLVVEKDPTYEWSATNASNNCLRQQFATEINVKIGLYAAKFVKNFRENLGGDPAIPHIPIQSFGYLYLADNQEFADVLVRDQKTQSTCGAGTKIMTKDEIAEAYPFFELDDIILGSRNIVDEGYFDALSMVEWWRRRARHNGVEYVHNEVVSMQQSGTRVETVTLKSGTTISAGTVVNAAGTRATLVSEMIGIKLPIEPRRRYTYVFRAEHPLDRDLPLTIDPTGVHFRTEGANYLVGCPPKVGDPAVDYDDFGYEDNVWEEKLWPILANRIPTFESIQVINSWIGHYEFNTFDHNAIVGPHGDVGNFIFVNGFSGHGSQQAPAMGRGVSELITYGEYREMDLSPFAFERLGRNEPLHERAVI